MKTGILTFSSTLNYGAVLQMYALCEVINSLYKDSDNSCEVINYVCDSILNEEYFFKFRNINSFHSLCSRIVKSVPSYLRYRKFIRFQKKFVPFSKTIYTKETIRKSSQVYDRFIVGSDQIWNLELTDNDYTFFLDFEKNKEKKYSYAASFGTDSVPNDQQRRCRELLLEFNMISVREFVGQKIVNDLIGKEFPVVLDPTLIMTKKQWGKFSVSLPIRKYILIYCIYDIDDNILSKTKLIATLINCSIVVIHSYSIKPSFGMKNIYTASPIEFINWIQGAFLIITDSFHGMALSVNFEKNFYYHLQAGKVNANSRLSTLSLMLGLENRNFDNFSNKVEFIDYSKITPLLEQLREKSLNILEGMIQ